MPLIEAGKVEGIDSEALATAMQDDDARVALLALAPGICEAPAWREPRFLSSREQGHTIGRWGGAGAAAARRPAARPASPHKSPAPRAQRYFAPSTSTGISVVYG